MNEEKPLWAPGEDAIAASNLTRFMHFLARHYGAYVANMRDLHAFSVRVPGSILACLLGLCRRSRRQGRPALLWSMRTRCRAPVSFPAPG